MLINLLSNALKFTYRGHIKIKVEDVGTLSSTRRLLQFAVEDTGIGIKEEDQTKLFKMFGKIGKSEGINPTGIGLGLTICNSVLNQFGSKL